MHTTSNRLFDKLYVAGLFFIVISLLFFSLPVFAPSLTGAELTLFVPCYILTAAYFFILLGQWPPASSKRKHVWFTVLPGTAMHEAMGICCFVIYVKGIADFYNSDHSSAICWAGSGYESKQIEKGVFQLPGYILRGGTITEVTGALTS